MDEDLLGLLILFISQTLTRDQNYSRVHLRLNSDSILFWYTSRRLPETSNYPIKPQEKNKVADSSDVFKSLLRYVQAYGFVFEPTYNLI